MNIREVTVTSELIEEVGYSTPVLFIELRLVAQSV